MSLFRSLGKLEQEKRLVIALDQAQEFRRLVGFDLVKLLAYIYDHVRSAQLVITGSQEGFLHGFLGVADPKSPFFGRYYTEVRLSYLTKAEALSFLELGFAQLKMKVDPRVLEEAVSRLNGIVGWLTFLGASVWEKGQLDLDTLEETLKKAAVLALDELDNFLTYRPAARRRYRTILVYLAIRGPARWADLRRALEAEEGRRLSPTVFNQLLGNLVKAGFIQKRGDQLYEVADPVLAFALRQ